MTTEGQKDAQSEKKSKEGHDGAKSGKKSRKKNNKKETKDIFEKKDGKEKMLSYAYIISLPFFL